MIRTFGLCHIALGVRDPDTSFGFYHAVFGMVAVYRDESFIQAQTPGARDVLVLERSGHGMGKSGGLAHFGSDFAIRRISRVPRKRSSPPAARS